MDYLRGKSICVGNGGFSLRKIKSFIRIAKWLPFIEPNLFKYGVNEDIIWSILGPKYFKSFKIPELNEALGFSIEESPEKAYELHNYSLPFGCHGWYNSSNIEFWKPFIEKFGHEL